MVYQSKQALSTASKPLESSSCYIERRHNLSEKDKINLALMSNPVCSCVCVPACVQGLCCVCLCICVCACVGRRGSLMIVLVSCWARLSPPRSFCLTTNTGGLLIFLKPSSIWCCCLKSLSSSLSGFKTQHMYTLLQNLRLTFHGFSFGIKTVLFIFKNLTRPYCNAICSYSQ